MDRDSDEDGNDRDDGDDAHGDHDDDPDCGNDNLYTLLGKGWSNVLVLSNFENLGTHLFFHNLKLEFARQ